ncbi:sulfonate transport system permease protein [Pseudomonas citronellolis]|uniref:Sulfonate transport system permease protein n=1 Tax=Pseudomonas citronellolis TaxID=53408 RepID=A0AAQ1HPB4_9PSED|nr:MULTISPECIES: ABC transporter permease [Pseudomonas]MCL6693405.1 ABC transporter permease [Pseudomonas sp. R3.Fl]TGC32618.1 ABC transporter permease [Pseudomonas citronellolis]UUC53267.1 ABC transporter permease [Pseudomonas citronellolis]SFD03918.1 sulfonate transport system permease protein [Pseudomonas citronellolis]
MRRIPLHHLTVLVSPLALLAAWVLLADSGRFPSQLLVPPREVWQAFVELASSGELREHLDSSLSRLALGFLIGAGGGLAFGTAMALSPNVEAYCGPLFHTLRQVPSIALIPMFILFFGVEETFKILIVTKATFFPVALATCEGVRGIPRSYFEVAQVYRLPLPTLLAEVAFPAAAPPILTGLRIGLSRAWMVLVAAELLAADSGLGQMIEMSRQMLRIDVVMVGVLVTGVIGFVLDYGFRLLERRVLRWKPL